MALLLPVDSSSTAYSFEAALDGTSFLFTVNWNERDLSWYISISDTDGINLIGDVRLAVGSELLHLVQDPVRKPQGAIVVYDTTADQIDPGRNDLGDRVRIGYLTAAEVAAL